MARATKQQRVASSAGDTDARPPFLILMLGYVAVAASLTMIGGTGIARHVLGYVAGSLVPILVIGVVRRVDLDRRRSPGYEPSGLLAPLLLVLAVLALVLAGVHLWPIATELAS